MSKILICDDEIDIVNALRIYLKSEGYEIFTASNGLEALDVFEREDLDLVLLDIMMPKMDGLSLTSKIRENSNIPIILLTAKSEDADKVLGLNLGADDYITKPFSPVEVIARCKSLLRRYQTLGSQVKKENHLVIDGIELDDETKKVYRDKEEIVLTPMEYNILKFLMENANKVFSSEQIYEAIWNDPAFGSMNTVAVHIRHLREKIEINPAEPRYVKVVWGLGYKFEGEKK